MLFHLSIFIGFLITFCNKVSYSCLCELNGKSPFGYYPIQETTPTFISYQPAGAMHISENGFQPLILLIFSDAKAVLDRIHVKEIQKTMHVMGIEIRFYLRDIEISDYNIDNVIGIFPNSTEDRAQVKIEDAFIQIVFVAEVIEKAPPYIRIGPANGTVNITFRAHCTADFAARGMNEDCPYHLKFKSSECSVQIQEFTFHLDDQPMVNSIIQFLVDQLKELFNTIIGDLLVQAVINQSLKTFAGRTEVGPILIKDRRNPNDAIGMDKRVAEVKMDSQIIQFLYGGVVTNKNKASLEYRPIHNVAPLMQPVIADIIYSHSIDVFSSYYDTFYRDEPGIFDYIITNTTSMLDSELITNLYSRKDGVLSKVFPSIIEGAGENEYLKVSFKLLKPYLVTKTGPGGMLVETFVEINIMDCFQNILVKLQVDPTFVITLDKHRELNLVIPSKTFHSIHWSIIYKSYKQYINILEILLNNTQDKNPNLKGNFQYFLINYLKDIAMLLTRDSYLKERSFQLYDSPFYGIIESENVVYKNNYAIWSANLIHKSEILEKINNNYEDNISV